MKSIKQYGSVLGLDNMRVLLEKMNHPEQGLKVVHVAGTNGKGSVIAYLESVLICAGYKVGKYTSPVVFDVRENFQLDGEYISKTAYAECMTKVKEAGDKMVKEGFCHPTPFEVETALAFLYFHQSQCDIVLLETGMGGETDATNVMDQVLCSVITSISLDHMNFLGDTVEEIAKIKAGIIKEGCDVVLYHQSEKVTDVIKKVCSEKKAHLCVTGTPENIIIDVGGETRFDYRIKGIGGGKPDCIEKDNDKGYLKHLKIKMPGTYQPYNAVAAIEAALILQQNGFELIGYIREGLKAAKIPGRFEIISHNPLILIDGAHNAGAAEKLKDSIEMYFTNKRIAFIMGVLADKDYEKVAELTAPLAESIVTVTPDNPRALEAEKLKTAVLKYNENVTAAESVEEALKISALKVRNEEVDCIMAFGSLSYLGDLKRLVRKLKNS